MRIITIPLLRKRSEHNEGQIHNLEELSLHQENLELIGPVLNRTCGSTLKILLLQNNVISKIGKDLRQCRALEYLNLALNNLTIIEGLASCEFLNKLDLTLNFVSLDNLQQSLDNLSQLGQLKDLYLIGNPCAEENRLSWKDKKYRLYVISKLPQLQTLDGVEIKKSERIAAHQRRKDLEKALEQICAFEPRTENCYEQSARVSDVNDEDLTEHKPDVRAEMSREMAKQLAEKERNERKQQPNFKGEEEIAEEHESAIEKAREREDNSKIRMCNEGKWPFRFDEEARPGFLLLSLDIQKHLSTSLIDVDVHPTYVSIVIKSKVLRLVLPAEVQADSSIAERSAVTGNLLVIMPKVNPNENMVGIRAAMRRDDEQKQNDLLKPGKDMKKNNHNQSCGLTADMFAEACASSAKVSNISVKIEGLVPPRFGGVGTQEGIHLGLEERETTRKGKNHGLAHVGKEVDDDDAPPPMF